MKISELEFNVMRPTTGWVKGEPFKLESYNIFHSDSVKTAVAMWVTGKAPVGYNFLYWCFGDFRYATEWEMMISSWPQTTHDIPTKYSIYDLYIEPNEKVLWDIINQLSIKSAEAWLKKVGK